MRIAIIGTGYVGLVTGACFADLGNDVVCIDVIEDKVRAINEGKVPIYEPGLEGLLRNNWSRAPSRHHRHGRHAWRRGIIHLRGDPSRKDGSLDLTLHPLRRQVGGGKVGPNGWPSYGGGQEHRDARRPPGMSVLPILERASGKMAGEDFGVAMNPEFLKEGMAVQDFMQPGPGGDRRRGRQCSRSWSVRCTSVRLPQA